jgi:type III secretion protein R
MMKGISPEILLVASLGIAMVPLMIAVGTCYLKFSIVLSLLRSGFGTQQAPSAALVMALSLVMSLIVMHPVLTDSLDRVADFKIEGSTSPSARALLAQGATLIVPWRNFLIAHSGDKELMVFSALAGRTAIQDQVSVDRNSVPVAIAVAAFVLSEMKRGFTLAFFLLIPFFVIDLVVANLLVAMGLTMMSPVIVSLPIKLLLFVSTDGWLLLAKNLIQAYQ